MNNKGYKQVLHEFTFQYGATSTISIAEASARLSVFTFQYGATSTEIDF